MPAFAGCNVKDWYNQNGTIRFQLEILGNSSSMVNEFQSVKVALYGVSLRQRDALNPLHFTFGTEPRVIDLVTYAKEGEEIPVTEFKSNMVPVVSVQLKVVVIEAITASGENIAVCRLADRPEKFPCFYQPDDDSLRYEEKPFAPPRGGEVTVHFPVAIKYATRGLASQYFLFADPTLVELENKR